MTLSPLYGRAFLTNDLVVAGGSGASARRLSMAWSQVGGLGSLASLLDVELDRLALLQGLQPAGLHRADVHEHILAPLGSDKAVAPVGVEPLDGATCHDGCLLRGAKRRRWYAAAQARPSRRLALRWCLVPLGWSATISPMAGLSSSHSAQPVIASGRSDRPSGNRTPRQAMEERGAVSRGGAADAPPAPPRCRCAPHPGPQSTSPAAPTAPAWAPAGSARHARRAPAAPRPARAPAATTPCPGLAARQRGPTAPETRRPGRRPCPARVRCRIRGRWPAPACRGRRPGCAPGRLGAAARGCSTRPWRHDRPADPPMTPQEVMQLSQGQSNGVMPILRWRSS